MDLIAKKHTILIGHEPLDLWLKNGKVVQSFYEQPS